MSSFIYRVKTYRFGLYPIKKLEVVKKTEKTVTVKEFGWGGKGCENRHALVSQNYQFFDTLKKAELATENLVANRMRESIARTDELRERLQEVCKHKAITGPSDGRCIRCNFKVPNPEEYCDGG